ncbi:IS5/IS1182 family transposase, partial [Streptomyces sp. NPDC059468]
MISADDPSWIQPFSGLTEGQFGKLVALVQRRGGDVKRGGPWRLPPGGPGLVGAPLLAMSLARRPRRDTACGAASSKNYRYPTNLQVVIDANNRMVVATGIPLPRSRHDRR